MNRGKTCIAMLLAGGQGSRLRVLTENTAKPAMPFGGKYRIIDFSLSNCINSGIDTVGILTQYQPLELNDYIGNGRPWDLDRSFGGAHILPPYTKSEGNEWYLGTANAIFQNSSFIERYRPTYVLVISGDHIYKMDYRKMLRFHQDHKAECTIAALDVSREDARRMGVLCADENGAVTEFEEKPKNPRSTRASMGVYMFTWSFLREYLLADEADPTSERDFGKNVIPAMLRDDRRVFAYPFSGYWKDVGTLESLWEANMDLLDPEDPLGMRDPQFKIYSRNYAYPSSLLTSGAVLRNAFVTEGCMVRGRVENSILSTGCTVEEGAVVRGSVIMPGTMIRRGAYISCAVVGENCEIGAGAHLGQSGKNGGCTDWPGISVLGHGKTLEAGEHVGAGIIR
ncbi:MAG: glucose-1-phosphate adenylyltransferase [Eubacteriales bacterium]|nr:glucose-1-phosphate adenylyltransferase [Eubacteriales bacterium]